MEWLYTIGRDGSINVNAFTAMYIFSVSAVICAIAAYFLSKDVNPKPKIVAVKGFFLGLFFPFGFIYLVVLMVRRYKSSKIKLVTQ